MKYIITIALFCLPLLSQAQSYIIPVVFHVVHQYGPENISDEQIYDAVKQVNIQLRKQNEDTTDIDPLFKNIAADTEIEIRLAQLDPDGNCTNGITRTASPLTLPGDHSVKDLIQWPPDQYLNIYVCKDAAGLAGHALMPGQADTVPEWDGIVMKHDYVGTIGTSSYFRRTVVTHEIGHYLNLQHIWGGNNVPDFYYLPVGDAGNCSYDDGVTDTPETIGWQSCVSNPQSCGTTDNIQNYMDYAYCALMFTEGQKTRMHNALNSNEAQRNNLWQPSNLAATGTDGVAILCAAKFNASKKIVCVGEPTTFNDISYHGITDRLWNFYGGNASSTTDSSVTVTYPSPGWYDVTLDASNGTDTVSVTLQNYIRVLPEQGTQDYLIEGFENLAIYQDDWTENHMGPAQTSIANIGLNSNSSLKFDNYNASQSEFQVISPPLDVSNLNALTIQFDYAFAPQSSSDGDSFLVLISNDCGETWAVRKSLHANINLETSQATTTPFTPGSTSEWASESINIPPSYLNQNFLVMFKLENDGGNNLYLDNINIAHPDALNLDNQKESLIRLYPNPTKESLHIYADHTIHQITIRDASGREVLDNSVNKQQFDLQHQLASGTYFVTILTEKGAAQRKFIVP